MADMSDPRVLFLIDFADKCSEWDHSGQGAGEEQPEIKRKEGEQYSDFTNLDLSDLDLSFSNYDFVDFTNSNFSGATLVGAQFTASKLTGTNFAEADINETLWQTNMPTLNEMKGLILLDLRQTRTESENRLVAQSDSDGKLVIKTFKLNLIEM
jgi:hypothetical protein